MLVYIVEKTLYRLIAPVDDSVNQSAAVDVCRVHTENVLLYSEFAGIVKLSALADITHPEHRQLADRRDFERFSRL